MSFKHGQSPLNPLNSPRSLDKMISTARASTPASSFLNTGSIIRDASPGDTKAHRSAASATAGALRVCPSTYNYARAHMADVNAQRQAGGDAAYDLLMRNHAMVLLPAAGQRTPRMTRERDLMSLNSLIEGKVE